VAVAGTRPSASAAAALHASPKDRDEHYYVVDDLVARLAAWGDVSVSATDVRTFGDLQHLVAEIQLEAREPLDFETLARTLHPTPALGVYTRGDVGMKWLIEIDPDGERHRFGAPFGICVPSRPSRCVVAIRNVQYRNGQLAIWAGCGVVALAGVSVPHFFTALILLGLGWNFTFVGASTLVTEGLRPSERTRVQGFNDLLIFVTTSVASLSAGKILAGFGWGTLNMTIFPFVLLAAVLVFWLARHEREIAAAS
jgi:hypothetical protein